jgi:WD40 repeat protein
MIRYPTPSHTHTKPLSFLLLTPSRSLQFCFSVALNAMSNFLSNSTNPNPNPNKSIEVNQPPTDSVSSLNFSPKSNLLVATSWDNQVLHFFFVFFNAIAKFSVTFSVLAIIFYFFFCRFVVGRLLVMELIMLLLCLRLL